MSSSALAQGAMLELYGEGVHRFYAGDLIGAEELFTRVVQSGTDDPRPYYFRGLVREHTGGDGTSDFKYGAQLEATGKNSVAVGEALTRVQGHVRAEIEKERRDARVAALQQRMALEAERAQAAPPAAPVAPTQPSDLDSPFDEGMRSEATTEDAAQPTTPEVDAATDPFADDPAAPATNQPAPAEAAPAADPFGGTDTSGSGNASDPFGGDTSSAPAPAPAAGDPFGGSGSSAPAPGDPFGGDTSSAPAPAPAAGDPFGGDSSSAPATDNPFGDSSSSGSDPANPFGN